MAMGRRKAAFPNPGRPLTNGIIPQVVWRIDPGSEKRLDSIPREDSVGQPKGIFVARGYSCWSQSEKGENTSLYATPTPRRGISLDPEPGL